MRSVVITGVGQGIGKALMTKYLDEGYFVTGTFLRNKPEERENLLLLQLDLRSSDSIKSCVQEMEKLGKKIDILHNNAGVLLDEDETQVIVEKLRGTLEVNLIGTVDFTEQMLPLLSQPAHIVNTSSSAGSLSVPEAFSHYPLHYPSYKISKTALNMYTKTLASRLKPSGVVVSSVHPGWVKTEMGGEEAEISPEEAAESIFKLGSSFPETGQFWYKDKKFPW